MDICMYVHACSTGKTTVCRTHAVHLRQACNMFMFMLWQPAKFNCEHSLMGHAADRYHLSGVELTAS